MAPYMLDMGLSGYSDKICENKRFTKFRHHLNTLNTYNQLTDPLLNITLNTACQKGSLACSPASLFFMPSSH